MIKRFLELCAILGMAVSLICFAISTTGCSTTTSAASTSVKTLDATLTAVDTAENVWVSWVAAEEVAIKRLPVDQQASATAKLAQSKAKAAVADAKFRVVYEAALTGAAGVIQSGNAPATADVLAAATALLSLLPLLQN